VTRRRRWLLGAAVVVGVLAMAGLALARPGGGGSYSGGGGHGDSGGDGDGFGELIFALIRLVFLVPELGVPLLLLLLGYIAWQAYKKHQNRDWDSGPAAPLARAASLDDLRRHDPDFSQAAFEDFVYRLYSAAHRSRGTRLGVDGVAPYVSAPARATLRAMAPVDAPVHGVIVGALRTIRVSVPAEATGPEAPAGDCAVVVEFESNVMAGGGAAHHTYFQVERWHLTRAAGVRSKPPAASAILPCPNCGAPWQAGATGSQQCASCDQVVDNGRFDWLVTRIELLAQDARPPSLTLDVPERGTDLPTYMQPGFAARWASLLADDPALTEAALQARVAHVFDTLARSWSSNDLTEGLRVVGGLVGPGVLRRQDLGRHAGAASSARAARRSDRATVAAFAQRAVVDRVEDRARVLELMRLPTPWPPPLQPVLTSQALANRALAIFAASSSAYLVGCQTMNAAPKHAENVASGSFTPISVPATFAV
jgi:hypothetical protein